MKITLMTVGSRGDVQPYVSLAHKLQQAGHDVLVTAPEDLVGFVNRSGIPAHQVAGNAQKMLQSAEGQKWLASGNMLAFMRGMKKLLLEIKDAANQDFWQACQGAEAIIAHPLTEDMAFDYAEILGIPVMRLFPFPGLPTGDRPSPVICQHPLPFRWLNHLTHMATNQIWWSSAAPLVNERRLIHGLEPVRESSHMRFQALKTPVLHIYSERVVPRPSDWGPEQVITGYWTLPDVLRARLGEGEPPADLVDWLQAGPAPIFIGFGSMPVTDPSAMLHLAVQVSQKLKQRIIIGAGWSAFAAHSRLPDDLFLIQSVNHEWLFPQCRAIVHHGGAGTTAASLRAGVPTLVTSVFADQPFWGETVRRLGVGGHLPFKHLRRDALADALFAIQTETVRQKVHALSKRLKQEDGLARAVEAIEEWLPKAPIPRLVRLR